MKKAITVLSILFFVFVNVTKADTCVSCNELFEMGNTEDGSYLIDPDGPGGQDQITVDCLMSLSDGGWTKLTDIVSNTILNQGTDIEREYLYVKNGRWYRTPISTLVWDWNSGKELTGTYYYYNGSIEQSFDLVGSSEKNRYGVGCSDGPFNNWKVLVYYDIGKNPANGLVQLCQDRPGIFGRTCQTGVTVYIRNTQLYSCQPAEEDCVEPYNYNWSIQILIDQSEEVFGDSQSSKPRNNRGLAISPDNRYLYAGYNSSLHSGGEVRRIDLTLSGNVDPFISRVTDVRGKSIAVDDVGRVYLAEGTSIQVYDATLSTNLFTISSLTKTEGVAVTRQGEQLVIYNTDRTDGTLEKRILVEDGLGISSATLDVNFGINGSVTLAGNLRGVEIDNQGRIWVAGFGNNTLYRISSDGATVDTLNVSSPFDIGFDGQAAMVTRYTDRLISRFDIDTLGSLGPDFAVPWCDLGLDSNGQSGNGALSGIVVLEGNGLYVANEAGQTTPFEEPPGSENFVDDNDPILFRELVNLVISKTHNLQDDLVDAGENITYEICLDEGPLFTLHGMTLVDNLPPEVVFVSATDNGAYDPCSHTVTWNLIDQPEGDQELCVQLEVNVPLDTPDETIIINTATITSDETSPTTALATVTVIGRQAILSVTPSIRNLPFSGGQTTFDVANADFGSMNWTAEVLPPDTWLTISSGASGTNSGQIVVDSQANDSVSSRSATIRITATNAHGSPQDVTVSQEGLTHLLVVMPSIRNLPFSGGQTTFDVANADFGNMNWTAEVLPPDSWLTISSGSSGTNSGQIVVNSQANSSVSLRSATIRVTAPNANGSPQDVTVSQDGFPTFRLTTVVPGGNGQIAVNPSQAFYRMGSVVSLTALPQQDYQVKKWSGTNNDSSIDNSNSVTMNSDRFVTLEFEESDPEVELTTTVIGGNGAISPDSGSHDKNTVVPLTAQPDVGYEVKAWNGTNDDSSTEQTNEVTMDTDKTVSVEFTLQRVTLTTQVIGGGGQINPPSGDFDFGTTVQLSSQPLANFKVKSWSGTADDSSTAFNNSVLMDADKTVSVQFDADRVLLTYTIIGGQGVIPLTSGPYDLGTNVPLLVTPAPGYVVRGWHGSNNDSTTTTSNSVLMNTDKTVLVELASAILPTKCKIVAGRQRGMDSLSFSGEFSADLQKLNGADAINISIWSSGGFSFQEPPIAFDISQVKRGKFTYSVRIGRNDPGGINLFKFNLNNNTFTVSAKNMDLTGLTGSLFVDIEIGDFVGVGQGCRTIPLQLATGAVDTLTVNRACITPSNTEDNDKLKVNGGIAVADLSVNLTQEQLVITCSNATFTIPAGSFSEVKPGKFTCKNDPVVEGGLLTATIDFNSNTFSILLTKINIESDPDSINFGLEFGQFNESVELNKSK